MVHRPRSTKLLTASVMVVLVGMLAGCSRSIPEIPSDSPLSPEADPAEPATLGVALRSDPPLPGETTPGWEGLGDADAGAHAHHHHQHGSKPAPESEAEPAPEQPAKGGGHDHH